MSNLEKGTRVKLSTRAKKAGIYRYSDQERRGTVVSHKDFYIRVHWDDQSPRSIHTYHPDFIVLDEPT